MNQEGDYVLKDFDIDWARQFMVPLTRDELNAKKKIKLVSGRNLSL